MIGEMKYGVIGSTNRKRRTKSPVGLRNEYKEIK